MRSGVAVASRWTCSSARRDAHRTASTSGGARGRRVTDGERGADAVGGALGARRVARVDHGERAGARADLLPQLGDVDEPDRVVDRVVLAPAAAAELQHRDAGLADVDGGDVAGRGREHLERVRGARQVAVRVVEQVGRPAERGAGARRSARPRRPT